MKIIITESQLNKAYFKYINYILDGIEFNLSKSKSGYRVYYIGDVRTFTYSERSEDVYFFKMYVDELRDMFNLDEEEALEIIGKWIQFKFGYPVRTVYSMETMSRD
jgi:hypothetical protein